MSGECQKERRIAVVGLGYGVKTQGAAANIIASSSVSSTGGGDH